MLAREKARNLSGTQDTSAPHKEYAPGWNEHLAVSFDSFITTYGFSSAPTCVQANDNPVDRCGGECKGQYNIQVDSGTSH